MNLKLNLFTGIIIITGMFALVWSLNNYLSGDAPKTVGALILALILFFFGFRRAARSESLNELMRHWIGLGKRRKKR